MDVDEARVHCECMFIGMCITVCMCVSAYVVHTYAYVCSYMHELVCVL